MSNLAETILRDVPIRGRIYTGGRINTGGNCLDELVLKKDVEAALTAAMDPALTERAGEVLSRLRKADEYEPLGHDGWEAADLITALLAQIAALRAERDASNELGRAFEEDAGQQRERAEAAEAQIAALTAQVERLTGAAKRMVAVWETPFTGASRRDAREQQDKAVDAAVSNIRAALSATTDATEKGGDAFEDRDSDRPNPATSPGVTAGADAAQAREAALREAHKAILAMDTKKDEDLTYNLAVLRAAEKVRRLIDEART